MKLLAARERQRLAVSVLSRQLDFDSLADFLVQQELAQYFCAHIESLELSKVFPASFRQKLQWQCEAQVQQREALTAALTVLHREFTSAGLEFLLLKGLHLAEQYWGSVENRFTWDLDMMIEPQHLDEAVHVLQQTGYRSTHASALQPRFVRRFSHAMEFKQASIAVDLHWVFRPRPGHLVDYPAIWRRRDSWDYHGHRYSVLAAEDALLMLLLGIAEDVERAEPNYRKLWDIYLMLRSNAVADWNGFFERTQQQGVGRLVVALLAFTCHALACADEFPELQQALARWSKGLYCSAAELDLVLARPAKHPANRLWIARLQPVSTAYYLAWWTVTAPMRYLVWRL
ncbi:MAG: nucleotidyltransferase family protein [Haliea sp.]|nr:nucleotidyltransferase family protein [Haliea sp.]